MANTIKLTATKRVANGSNEARRVRRSGFIPAALMRLSRETETLQINAHDYMMAMRGEASEQLLVELDIDGATVSALQREVQHDVISGEATHLDFSEVDMAKPIRASVMLTLTGEPEGVRVEGGVLSQVTHEITVECLPSQLVESFDVDVSGLKLGDDITVASLSLGDGYEIITPANTPIATVTAVEVEEEASAGAVEAAPEVVAKGKKDEEQGGDKGKK